MQRHEQLDAVMAVRGRHEAWAPHDHRRRPGCHSPALMERHEQILASRGAACKSASSFKTRANVAH